MKVKFPPASPRPHHPHDRPASFASCAVLRHRKDGPGVDLPGSLAIPILSVLVHEDIDPEEHREAENLSVDGP